MRFEQSLLLITALALPLSAGQASAKPAKAAKPTNVTGIVQSIHPGDKSFVLHIRKGFGKKAQEQDLTVMTNAGTTFKHVGKLPLTRKPAAFADLKADEKVQVKGLPAKDGKVGATDVLIKHDPKK